MQRLEILSKLENAGIVAVMRLTDTTYLGEIVQALAEGGIKTLEITMTSPNAPALIKHLTQTLDASYLIGAGTVVDVPSAEEVIQAGAQFVVSPIFNPAIITKVHEYDKVSVCGAFSPTEIFNAWQAGADLVKVFPATALGPQFFKDIHGPFPNIKLTPTGGVSIENAADFIKAGAVCLGVGTALLDKQLLKNRDWQGLTARAAAFMAAVNQGRTATKG
jgi:2-dehydro-3-deoxyphosphogluconate aldolase/(4S)-4-hydroxy-2-oxoglutarate aldolase